jgi:hypothetical protein
MCVVAGGNVGPDRIRGALTRSVRVMADGECVVLYDYM